MIRNTLSSTKKATFAILFPEADIHGLSWPRGTGFFVSPDGWFVTAAHVITKNGKSDGPLREDISQIWLEKEPILSGKDWGAPMYQHVTLEHIDPNTDFALLKVDFEANSKKDSLKDCDGFPYIEISLRQMEEGEPVYSFGYPLSSSRVQKVLDGPVEGAIGELSLSPRTTSAIVSSNLEKTSMQMSTSDLRTYVLDKALNYGNSGGPIIATETGNVHAFCSRFQPVSVRQPHFESQIDPPEVQIPSLYGIVISLSNKSIVECLKSLGVPILEE